MAPAPAAPASHAPMGSTTSARYAYITPSALSCFYRRAGQDDPRADINSKDFEGDVCLPVSAHGTYMTVLWQVYLNKLLQERGIK